MTDRVVWMISQKAKRIYLTASLVVVLSFVLGTIILAIVPYDAYYELPSSTATYIAFAFFFSLVAILLLTFVFLWSSMIYGVCRYDVPFTTISIMWLGIILMTGPFGAAAYYLFRFSGLTVKKQAFVKAG